MQGAVRKANAGRAAAQRRRCARVALTNAEKQASWRERNLTNENGTK
jgi:hypothetical protein